MTTEQSIFYLGITFAFGLWLGAMWGLSMSDED